MQLVISISKEELLAILERYDIVRDGSTSSRDDFSKVPGRIYLYQDNIEMRKN